MMNDELYHYGVPGMKWGHRKTYSTDGSKRTVKKLNKFLDADKKYGPNRTARQDRKVNKLYKKYDKSAGKDVKRALKSGNKTAVNNITAGRTYAKIMMDRNFLTMALSDTARQAKVETGKNFTYNVMRNNKLGGVTVTVNGHSEQYVYMPELKKKRK